MQPARAAVAKANRAAPATMVIMADLLSGQTGQPLSAPRFRTAGAISFYAPPSCGIISMRPLWQPHLTAPLRVPYKNVALCQGPGNGSPTTPAQRGRARQPACSPWRSALPFASAPQRYSTHLSRDSPPSTAAMSPAKPPSTDGSYQPRSSTSASCWDGYSRNGLLSQP